MELRAGNQEGSARDREEEVGGGPGPEEAGRVGEALGQAGGEGRRGDPPFGPPLTFDVVGQRLPRRGEGDAVAAPGGEELHGPGAAGAQHGAAHRVCLQQRQRVRGRVERGARGRAGAGHRQQQQQQPRRRRPRAPAAPAHPAPWRPPLRTSFGRVGVRPLRRSSSVCRGRSLGAPPPPRPGTAPFPSPRSAAAREPL